MRYLFDVNALVALLVTEHSLHTRTLDWVRKLVRGNESRTVLTCSITELGFLRIVGNTYGRTVEEAHVLLNRAKAGSIVRFTFIHDDQPASALPAWVVRPSQITDGHLAALGRKHGAVLATLNEQIPGAFVIPR